MRRVPDWWIQTSWSLSAIFAGGALWYFLSLGEYGYATAAGVVAAIFAILAIVLHRKKDAFSAPALPRQQTPFVADKTVTPQWWDASDLRREYESRGLTRFYWSDVDRVPEREQQGYQIVYLDDTVGNNRFRIVNKSGQVLMAKA